MKSFHRHALLEALGLLGLLGLGTALEAQAGAPASEPARGSDQNEVAAARPQQPWRARFTLPSAGVGHFSNPSNGPSGGSADPFFQVDLSAEWGSAAWPPDWMIETEFGIVDVVNRSYTQTHTFLRLGAGPSLTLLDTRVSTSGGTTLALQGQLGSVLRTGSHNSDGNEYGQPRLGARADLESGKPGLARDGVCTKHADQPACP